MTKEKLNRINALANKAKTSELTAAEKTEQKKLRQEYLGNVRSSFTNQISSLTVIDPEGNDVTPDKVKQMQKQNQQKNKH